LVTDRTTLSPEDLRNMQAEIMDVIRKYCRVSEEDVDLKLEQRDRENYLVADIPLRKGSGNTRGDGGSVRIETSLVSSANEDAEPSPAPQPTESVSETKPSRPTEEIPLNALNNAAKTESAE